MFGLSETENEEPAAFSRVIVLLLLGVVLIFVGVIVLAIASLVLGGHTSSAVIIFIGPFPIVFGSGPDAVWLILIGVIIAAISVAVFIVMNRRLREFSQ